MLQQRRDEVRGYKCILSNIKTKCKYNKYGPCRGGSVGMTFGPAKGGSLAEIPSSQKQSCLPSALEQGT